MLASEIPASCSSRGGRQSRATAFHGREDHTEQFSCVFALGLFQRKAASALAPFVVGLTLCVRLTQRLQQLHRLR